MFGWRRRETIVASSMNIVTKSLFRANSSRILLMATTSPVPSRRRATWTAAIPPSAIFARSSYGPSRSVGLVLSCSTRLPLASVVSLGSQTAQGTKGRAALNRRTMRVPMTLLRLASPGLSRFVLGVASAGLAGLALASCKDPAKESATHAAEDAAQLATLVEKDVGEVERGVPEGAKRLAPLLADGADPKQDVAGVRRALLHVRRDVVDLNVAKSTFFALADPGGTGIRNDLEEDVMAGQNLALAFPILARAKEDYVTGTGAFPGPPPKNGPDEDWIAAAPVKRADGSTGALLVTGWSYRYFARHLQEALKTRLLAQAKAAGEEGRLPVYYVAVFDKSGVYPAPLTPQVDEKALADEDLVGKTASGPFQGTVTITDRAFGFPSPPTPRLAPDPGVAALRPEPSKRP